MILSRPSRDRSRSRTAPAQRRATLRPYTQSANRFLFFEIYLMGDKAAFLKEVMLLCGSAPCRDDVNRAFKGKTCPSDAALEAIGPVLLSLMNRQAQVIMVRGSDNRPHTSFKNMCKFLSSNDRGYIILAVDVVSYFHLEGAATTHIDQKTAIVAYQKAKSEANEDIKKLIQILGPQEWRVCTWARGLWDVLPQLPVYMLTVGMGKLKEIIEPQIRTLAGDVTLLAMTAYLRKNPNLSNTIYLWTGPASQGIQYSCIALIDFFRIFASIVYRLVTPPRPSPGDVIKCVCMLLLAVANLAKVLEFWQTEPARSFYLNPVVFTMLDYLQASERIFPPQAEYIWGTIKLTLQLGGVVKAFVSGSRYFASRREAPAFSRNALELPSPEEEAMYIQLLGECAKEISHWKISEKLPKDFMDIFEKLSKRELVIGAITEIIRKGWACGADLNQYVCALFSFPTFSMIMRQIEADHSKVPTLKCTKWFTELKEGRTPCTLNQSGLNIVEARLQPLYFTTMMVNKLLIQFTEAPCSKTLTAGDVERIALSDFPPEPPSCTRPPLSSRPLPGDVRRSRSRSMPRHSLSLGEP